jgi:NADH-quinone oxidoreductase subunit E
MTDTEPQGEVLLLAKTFKDEIESILAKYPEDQRRSAVMPLLFLAQRELGYVNAAAMEEISEITGLTVTEIGGLLGFYTLFHDEPGGTHRIQICTDLPCALRGADKFLEDLCENLGVRVAETTEDGMFTIEEVMCLAGCDHAPMFQIQDSTGIHYHEDQTVETALAVLEELKAEGSDG